MKFVLLLIPNSSISAKFGDQVQLLPAYLHEVSDRHLPSLLNGPLSRRLIQNYSLRGIRCGVCFVSTRILAEHTERREEGRRIIWMVASLNSTKRRVVKRRWIRTSKRASNFGTESKGRKQTKSGVLSIFYQYLLIGSACNRIAMITML